MAFHEWLVRWRFALLGAALGHFMLMHWFVLGFMSWDAFGHRVPPVVELVKHGSLGLEKYSNWALVGFRPFVELTHAPFLWVFGLEGLFLAFPLVLFPFCVVSIWLFTREVTRDRNAAFYAACTYVLIPLVNSQLFAGYVDWAIPGLLAFFLYALISVDRAPSLSWKALAKVTLGTFLFTMSRQQAPYLAVFFGAITLAMTFVERRERRLVLPRRREAGLTALAGLVGFAPAAIAQVLNLVRHGTPIYPYQFNMLGLKLGNGYSIQSHPTIFGLAEYSVEGLAKASVTAWLVPSTWPAYFFDGRWLGAGLLFITALVTAPLSLRRANLRTRVLLAAFVIATLGGKDFWNPRFAYTLLLSLAVMNGLALSALLERPKWRPYFAAHLALLGLHLLRPEWEAVRVAKGDAYFRMNLTGSPWYLDGCCEVVLYPDMNASFVIADEPGMNFALPLYGRRMTNSVLGSVAKHEIGPRCEGLLAFQDRAPNVLVVDDQDLTKACARTCVASAHGRCLAYRLEP